MDENDNYRQATAPFWKYDSDTDLPLEVQQKLQMLQQNSLGNSNIMGAIQQQQQAENLRQQAWQNAGAFDKIKSFLKAAALGDIRQKK